MSQQQFHETVAMEEVYIHDKIKELQERVEYWEWQYEVAKKELEVAVDLLNKEKDRL
jgi:hypothetical protein